MGRYDAFFEEPSGKTTAAQTVTDSDTPETNTDSSSEGNTLNESPYTATEAEQSVTSEVSTQSDADESASQSDAAAKALADKKATMKANITALHGRLSDKRRFMGDSVFNQMVAADWFAVIEADPQAFDALLYRPADGVFDVVKGPEDSNSIEGDAFTELDNNQRNYDYTDPVIVTVRVSNDGREAYQATDDDTAQDGLVDDFLMLTIAAKGIAKGSMLEWKEEQLDGSDRIVSWHVSEVFSFGTQHVGTVYYCIPARTYDTTREGLPL